MRMLCSLLCTATLTIAVELSIAEIDSEGNSAEKAQRLIDPKALLAGNSFLVRNDAEQRKLQTVLYQDLQFSIEAGTSHSHDFNISYNDQNAIVALAGQPVKKITLVGQQTLTFPQFVTEARLRLVPETMTQFDATAGRCATDYLKDAHSALLGRTGDPGLLRSGTVVWDLFPPSSSEGSVSMSHRRRSAFRVGGTFKFCYQNTGSWTTGAQLVPAELPRINVYGAVMFAGFDLMGSKRHYCFAGAKLGTNCKVTLTGVNGNTTSGGEWQRFYRLTWALPLGWEDTCGSGIPLSTLGLGSASAPYVLGGQSGLVFDLGHTPGYFEARNFWLCYCPGINADNQGDPCTAKEDFLQEVGLLLVFTSTWLSATIVPVTRFGITVRCGDVNGCANNQNNRLKILDPSSFDHQLNINNQPIWDPTSGCRVSLQSTKYLAPPNCVSATECAAILNGGSGVDYKYFTNMKVGNTIMAGLTQTRQYDICYCNDNCRTAANWFKVGEFNVSKAQTLPDNQLHLDFNSGTTPNLQVVNTPGLVRLNTATSSYPDGRGGITNSFKSSLSLIKLLLENTLGSVTDANCADNRPTTAFTNHGCSTWYQCYPYGWKNGTSQVVVFNALYFHGGLLGPAWQGDPLVQDTSKTIMTVAVPGIYAVCYCDDECNQKTSWAKLTRLEIRGATGGQTWLYQTMIPFDLKVTGVGLHDGNTVKIIYDTERCDSSTTNWFQLHIAQTYYPYFNATILRSNSSVWRFAGPQASQGNPIVNILDYPTGSELRFAFDATRSGVYTDLIKAGDTLVLSNLTVDNNGIYPYIYPATDEQKEMMTVSWGQEISSKIDNDPTNTRFASRAKLAHPDGTIPTWSATMRAAWKRSSQARYVSVESTEARKNLKVCWSDSGAGNNDWVIEAGRLDLEDAPLMEFSTADLVTTAAGEVAPIVLAFRTSFGSASRYQNAVNEMMLKVYFQDPHIHARASNVAGDVLLHDPLHDDITVADQVTCGKLFKELWSNHVNGFPVPKGCFYQQAAKSYSIVFAKQNGMAASTEYQVVMNAQATAPAAGAQTYWQQNLAVRIWSLDDVILRREFAVEVGLARLRTGRTPQAVAHGQRAQLVADSFNIHGAADAAWPPSDRTAVDLSVAPNINLLSFDLKVKNGTTIQAQQLLRLFFSPLTQWRLGATCVATCSVVNVTGNPACGTPSCLPEPLCVHTGAQQNFIKLEMPTGLGVGFNASWLKLSISGLVQPTGGLFPSHLAAEISDSNSHYPSYSVSSGRLVYVPPQLSFGGVVSSHIGDGNAKPFAGDLSNELYVRIVLGASLHSQFTRPPAFFPRPAQLELHLPAGYTCIDANTVPATLNVFGTSVPQGRGDLPVNTTVSWALGFWTFYANTCVYYISPMGAITAGSSILLKLIVNNPLAALPQSSAQNVWHAKMRSYGDEGSNQSYTSPARPFVSNTAAYNANIAVQGKLVTSVSPLIFTPGTLTNKVYVFIFTLQDAGQRAQIRVLGPHSEPYDFEKKCVPGLLPDRYYVDVSPAASTYPLPGMARQITCQGLQSTVKPANYYGALLQLSGRLRGNRNYGFSLQVGNPNIYAPSQKTEWSIITLTSTGSEIDGTHHTSPFNPRQPVWESFGMYTYQPSNNDLATKFILQIDPILPTSASGTTSWFAIGGIEFPSDVSCRLRAILPSTYQFDYLQREFLYRAPEVMPLLPNGGTTTGGIALVDRTLPAGYVASPLVEPKNELTWSTAGNFKAGEKYGFAAKVRVPDYPNTRSINVFYLQCGFAETTIANRPLAATVEAPVVAALADAAISFATNVRGVVNIVRFQVRTATAVRTDAALVLDGPPGFGVKLVCDALTASPPMNARLVALRSQLLAYEALVTQQQIAEASFGLTSPQKLNAQAQVSVALDALKLEVLATWQERVANNALPIDIGCRGEASVTFRQTVRFIFQVGLPNLPEDLRLGVFARTHFGATLFPNGQHLEAWLPAGLYRFDIEMTNPSSVLSNEQVVQSSAPSPPPSQSTIGTVITSSTACGYEMCWTFATYKTPYSSFVVADRSAVAKGFAVVELMPEGFLVNLTEQQRQATSRNDQPRLSNQLIFAFKLDRVLPPGLSKTPPVVQQLILRGPQECIFQEDCVVVTAYDAVFGSPLLWPTNMTFSRWTNMTGTVTSCLGLGSTATITITGADGFVPGQKYAFRIDVLENPIATPVRNQWTLSFHGHRALQNHKRHSESSNPFQGFDTWTFSSVRTVPLTTERSTGVSTDPNGGIILNSVTTLFQPHNDVPGPGGLLSLTAPNSFEWLQVGTTNASSTSGGTGDAMCDAVLRERPLNLSASALAVEASGSLSVPLWDVLQTKCVISPLFKTWMMLEIVGNRGLSHGRMYALVATMKNPVLQIASPGNFELRSKQPSAQQLQSGATAALRQSTIISDYNFLEDLDQVLIPGFPSTKEVQSLSAQPAAGTIARGGTIGDIRVSAILTEAVFPNDVIQFTVPPTFKLRPTSATSSFYSQLSRQCLKVINRGKPGVYPEQQLKCFWGLFCILNIWGVNLRSDSKVELNLLSRPCGDLPGQTIDIRRTSASSSGSTVQKSYNLGFYVSVGQYRVCYCHGDGGCVDFAQYCQEVGNLTVVDLCTGTSCPGNISSCETRCDPRAGVCVPPSHNPLVLPDDAPCTSSSGAAGLCKAGRCLPTIRLRLLNGLVKEQGSPSTSIENEASTAWRRQQGSNTSSQSLSCVFDRFECTDRNLSWTIGHFGYQLAETLNLDVRLLYPELSPVADNVVMLQHIRANNVRSTRVVPAFTIQPEFRGVYISLVGPLLAGGSLTTIEFHILAVSAASSLWSRAKMPIGFDFSQAKLLANGTIMSALDDTIEMAVQLRPLVPLYLRLTDVRLPAQGGQGIFDVFAYNGSILRDSTYNVQAFWTPAHIDISEASLRNQYKRDTSGNFQVEASFGNQLGFWAQLSFRLRFSATLPANQRVRISARSWKFSPASARWQELHNTRSPVTLNFTLSQQGQPLPDGSAAVLDMVTSQPLQSQTHHSYLVQVDVFAPEASACACWATGLCSLCNSNWTVEVFDFGQRYLATNDGKFGGFPLVSELRWSVFTPRQPPEAFLNITLRFSHIGAVHATMLIVTAPANYVFPYLCHWGASASPDLPQFQTCTGRLNTAILALDHQGLFRPTTLTLKINTPLSTPIDNRWFLEGRQAIGNVQVGWGVATGLAIDALNTASVEYASFQNLPTYFLVKLNAAIDVLNGGYIHVFPPAGYMLKCDNFIKYAMPFSGHANYRISCARRNQGVSMEFAHAHLRAATQYSFIVEGTTAAQSVPNNYFVIKVLDNAQNIVEAKYDVPAFDLRYFGGVLQPLKIWYDTPVSLGKIWATMILVFPYRAPAGLERIRIILPDGAAQEIKTSARDHSAASVSYVARLIAPRMNPPGTFSDYLLWTQRDATEQNVLFNSSLSQIPLQSDQRLWLDLGRTGEVQLRFQDWRVFPACEIMLRFPLVLPNTLPTVNIWQVAFVFSGSTPGAPVSVSTFVVPGFQFGDTSDTGLVSRAQNMFAAQGLDYFAFSATVANAAESRVRSLCTVVWLLWTHVLLAQRQIYEGVNQ